MSIYECELCSKIFKRRCGLTYHADKKVCVGKTYLSDNGDNDNTYKCKFCNKGFTSATSMYRHVNHNCKIKRADTQNKEKILEDLVKLKHETEEQQCEIIDKMIFIKETLTVKL